jgi:ADP-heptose:LPS heptosyltransferase
MAVAAASAIRNTYPDSFIAWAIDSRCAAMVDTATLVDVRYEVPRQQWKSAKVSWLEQYRHFARLRRFKFDFGLDLQGHSKTALCLRIANPKTRIATRATDVVARVLNPVIAQKGAPKHTVERNLFALRQLGDFSGDDRPIMPKLSPLPPQIERSMSPKLATISIGAGHPKKCYSPSQWNQVGRNLADRGYDVAFLGGPEDRDLLQPDGHNWIGELSLDQTLAVVARSQIHLAADTGTGHMAAACGVPVVSVFGYTDIEEYRPYTNNAIILNAGRAMDGVSPAEIVDSVELLVGRQRSAVLN